MGTYWEAKTMWSMLPCCLQTDDENWLWPNSQQKKCKAKTCKVMKVRCLVHITKEPLVYWSTPANKTLAQLERQSSSIRVHGQEKPNLCILMLERRKPRPFLIFLMDLVWTLLPSATEHKRNGECKQIEKSEGQIASLERSEMFKIHSSVAANTAPRVLRMCGIQ